MSLGTEGLGDAGLALEGVGLGGAGLESGAGAAPAVADPDIDDYFLLSADISSTIVANQQGTPYFNPDGDRVYFARTSSFQSLQYGMSVAGDMATLTGNFEASQNWFSASATMRGITLTPDRSKAYNIRTSGNDDTLVSADPFSVAALGDPAQNPYQLLNAKISAVMALPLTPRSLVAAPNNLDLFVQSADVGDRGIYHFQMSVAGDSSTVTALGKILNLNAKFSTRLIGIMYTPDGSKLFVLGDNGGTLSIAQFDLSTAYDVTTAVDSGKSLTVTPAQTGQLSLFVWENPAGGFKLYLTSMPSGNGTDLRVDTYEAPGGDAPNITEFSPDSYSGDISASAVDPNGVFVDASGTRVFVVNGSPGNDIDSYSMSVPFDLTTLSAVIASEAISSSPIGVFLKPDGTKLFVTAFGGSVGVQEFTLSTPWDITTKGSLTLLSTVGDGATIPFGLHFSSDGLNVYTSDNGGNLYQWSLAAPWDVSSPTFIGSFDFTNELAATKGQDLSLSADGTRLYLVDIDLVGDSLVFQYTLDTPFDVTTAVYHGIVLTLSGRIGSSGFHMLDANDRFYAAYNGDSGGANPEALEEFILGTRTDDNFDDVVLLLDFAGADGGTDITDLSNSGHVDTFVGDAEIDTAVTALGRNTVLLDGSGDYITFPDSADWDFGTGDFTVECHFQSNLNAVTGLLLSQYDTPLGWSLQHLSGAALRFLVGDTQIKSELWNPVEGTVFHVAVTRSGTDVRMFIDGVELGSATTDSTDLTGSTNPLTIGALAVPQQFVNGNIGAVRITKGVARYTANFTPPNQFYPTE